jgi:hypothetical protein
MITMDLNRRTGNIRMKLVLLIKIPVEQRKATLILAMIMTTGSLRSNNLLCVGPFSIGVHQVSRPFEALIEAYNRSVAHFIV